MRAVKFCSECGAQLKITRASILPFRSFCPRCLPRFRGARLMLIAALGFCAAGGYTLGRYTTPRQPFYLIGTPIDLNANRSQPSSNKNSVDSFRQRENQATNTNTVESACGARTKSGRPCRRKVIGGGYCWQHRDKLKPTKAAASAQ
jgi:hypothetical protein